MISTERSYERKPKLAREIFPDVEDMKISNQALMEFLSRTGVSLEESIQQLRPRLGNARHITSHPNVDFRKGCTYFQDSMDENLFFVVKTENVRGKRTNALVKIL